jgi:hypothetical protein
MSTSPIPIRTGSARVSVVFPSGMLGSGFSAASVARGVELGATAIAIDAGSTDSGPYYLGAGVSKSAAAAVKRDLRILLIASRGAGIPLIVGSCGTSGTDAGVDWTSELARQIAMEEGLSFSMALIYSEQSPGRLARFLAEDRIRPLPPADPLDQTTLRSCAHIVGAMGHEPIVAALDRGRTSSSPGAPATRRWWRRSRSCTGFRPARPGTRPRRSSAAISAPPALAAAG